MLHRKMVEWEWYTEPNVVRLFIHCLLRANHVDAKWRGVEIKRGQFVTSADKLATELGLTRQKIRTALANLQITNEITIKTSTQHTVITVNNYDSYQASTNETTNNQPAKQPSNNQRDNHQITTNNNDKNYKNENKNILSGTPDHQSTCERDLNSEKKEVAQVTTARKKTTSKKRPHKQAAEFLIDYLNGKIGSRFEKVDSNLKRIEAVLAVESRDVGLVQKVIDFKVKEWGSDEKMVGYLRPSTLFRPENFSNYAGQLSVSAKKDNQLDDWINGKELNAVNQNQTIDGVWTNV
jgi:uncharacterized phage protein (TIGR02220 family)